MTIRVGVVMDPIKDIHYQRDTTLAILWEAKARGWEIYYFEPRHLYIQDGVPFGEAHLLDVFHDEHIWFKCMDKKTIPLSVLDVIFIRKDPPFNDQYLYMTFLLELAERLGVFIVNRPEALRDANEKMFITHFPQCTPPTLVTQSMSELHHFWEEQGDIVCKPLNGMRGVSVFRLRERDVNANALFSVMTGDGTHYIMAQRFIPDIVDGDKRILMIDGEPVSHVLARIPQGNEWRGGLALGARTETRPLTERDRFITSIVGPELRNRGLYFVGLDVIGDYLTEINVTSPTGVRALDEALGTNISAQLLDVVERSMLPEFKQTPYLKYWLAAMYLSGIGPRRIVRWLEQFDDIEKFFMASREELSSIGLTVKQIEAVRNPDWQSVERDLAWAESAHCHLMTLDDDDYPLLLKETQDPPVVLFIRGNRSALNQTQLAIVGSRHPSAAGLHNAEQFAQYLAQTGLVITSGLALGIDGASHRGALNANGLTIGVCGTGLNHLYPAANKKLAEEIIERQGAVISEFPLHTAPQASNFPRRNRIISGLSVGVLVVEAALKSGSLITARFALEQNREVFAIPGSIHQPLSRGCHALIRQGAKLVETAEDVMEELSAFRQPVEPKANQLIRSHSADKSVNPEFRSIFDHVGHEMTPLDMIILRSGLTRGEVSSILLKLELHGYIHSVTGGYVRATPNE